MSDTRKFEEYLANQFNYKRLPDWYSKKCRDIFTKNIPSYLSVNGDNKFLYTINGSLISIGYKRIVIGDYGAFIEYTQDQASVKSYIVKPGQEYRINDPKYSRNVKYHWYTIDDNSNIKIYHQIKRVSYADYIPGMYYVSVHEVKYK